MSVRHDLPDSSFLVPDAAFPALIDLHPGDCMASLIDESHLLTVAHCASDFRDGDTVNVHGTPHRIEKVIIHPAWNDERNQNDIALLRLENPVTGIRPLRLYRGSKERGAFVALVGRGLHTTGLVGEDGGTEDLKLRRVTNVVQEVNGQNLVLRFRRPGEKDITGLEGVGVSGDSGCPVFIEAGGELELAGLNSWGDAKGGLAVGEYGAFDYETRISRFLDWIDANVSRR